MNGNYSFRVLVYRKHSAAQRLGYKPLRLLQEKSSDDFQDKKKGVFEPLVGTGFTV